MERAEVRHGVPRHRALRRQGIRITRGLAQYLPAHVDGGMRSQQLLLLLLGCRARLGNFLVHQHPWGAQRMRAAKAGFQGRPPVRAGGVLLAAGQQRGAAPGVAAQAGATPQALPRRRAGFRTTRSLQTHTVGARENRGGAAEAAGDETGAGAAGAGHWGPSLRRGRATAALGRRRQGIGPSNAAAGGHRRHRSFGAAAIATGFTLTLGAQTREECCQTKKATGQ
mmetsp:Transcript_9526/g.28655  ORF Transcript_9526/g.28655 Transcript_9526/m.28655 type:complete len:225 (+) Transcript_9526:1328-2002(+)